MFNYLKFESQKRPEYSNLRITESCRQLVLTISFIFRLCLIYKPATDTFKQISPRPLLSAFVLEMRNHP